MTNIVVYTNICLHWLSNSAIIFTLAKDGVVNMTRIEIELIKLYEKLKEELEKANLT